MAETPDESITLSSFTIAVGVFGGIAAALLLLILALFVWTLHLARRVKELEPLANFKFQRPKLINREKQEPSIQYNEGYENPNYFRNNLQNGQNGQNGQNLRTELNPMARRSKTSFDNVNFSFTNPNRFPKSFRDPDPDYLEDSRFY